MVYLLISEVVIELSVYGAWRLASQKAENA